MFKHKVRAVGVALLSAGWVVPLFFGINAYLSFWRAEAWPLLRGDAIPRNSFPFLQFASNCFMAALAWLGIAMFLWAYATVVACSEKGNRTSSGTSAF